MKKKYKKITIYRHKKEKLGECRYSWPFKLPKGRVPITLDFNIHKQIGTAKNFSIEFKRITADIHISNFPKLRYGAIVPSITGYREKNMMKNNEITEISLISYPYDRRLIGNYLK